MKHFLTGVGMVAALALSAPTWAQPTSPGGNAVGMPGPNPADAVHYRSGASSSPVHAAASRYNGTPGANAPFCGISKPLGSPTFANPVAKR